MKKIMFACVLIFLLFPCRENSTKLSESRTAVAFTPVRGTEEEENTTDHYYFMDNEGNIDDSLVLIRDTEEEENTTDHYYFMDNEGNINDSVTLIRE